MEREIYVFRQRDRVAQNLATSEYDKRFNSSKMAKTLENSGLDKCLKNYRILFLILN